MEKMNEILWEKPSKPPGKKQKVVFARRADTAQLVAEADTASLVGQPIQAGTESPQIGQQDGLSTLPTPKKIGILQPWGKAGRPRKNRPPQLQLPPGLKVLRRGKVVWSPEVGESFIEAYYSTGGSFTRACRKTNVSYSMAMKWRKELPEFQGALAEIDQIIRDEVHSQFMERVLNTWEPNPAWKFKYFQKHFPEYHEGKKQITVTFDLKDTLIRPNNEEIIDAEIIQPKQLGTGDEPRPELIMETPANTGKVPAVSE